MVLANGMVTKTRVWTPSELEIVPAMKGNRAESCQYLGLDQVLCIRKKISPAPTLPLADLRKKGSSEI